MSSDVTKLLAEWSGGNEAALDRLIPIVYRELRLRARNYLRRERPEHTLQPTALINEVYLRLVSDKPEQWQDRSHFMAVASRVMRQILVGHASRHVAGKRR
jgi:RNA polymerase sigma factor (TIGR02999 family)